MRINKFVAEATGSSRRHADDLVASGKIEINGTKAELGSRVSDGDVVTLNGTELKAMEYQYVLLNKPVGYVSSRKAQDEKPTLYELLPQDLHHLKPAGRLDADSHGLILLTNDGQFAHEIMHPSNRKKKIYHVKLDKELSKTDQVAIESGLHLEDGESAFTVEVTPEHLVVTMEEGRNRQIRRTFEVLEYEVTDLKRVAMGAYSLDDIAEGDYAAVEKKAS